VDSQDSCEGSRKNISSDLFSQGLFENSPAGIAVTDLDGRFLMVNPAFQGILGYAEAELLQLTLLDLIEPADRIAEQEHLSGLRSGVVRQHQAEKCCRCKDGSQIWILISLSLIPVSSKSPGYLLAIAKDVTDSRRAKDELKAHSEILQKVFDHIPLMINFTAADGHIKLVNRAWEHTLGWSLEEIQNRGTNIFEEFYPDPQYRQGVMNFISAATGEWADFQPRVRDGRTIDTSWAEVKLSDGTTIGIGAETTERKRAEYAIQRSIEQLRALAAGLESVREEERTRLSREIHDGLGQILTAIKMELKTWTSPSSRPRGRARQEQAILRLIDEAIQSVRKISTELRPGMLDDLGLLAAVEWATEDFAARTKTKCALELSEEELAVGPEVATALFRILQEALTNIARHAEATEFGVRLAQDDGGLRLEVQDNGKGFDESQVSPVESLGILGMRERAALLGGRLAIRSSPGKGTTVIAWMPAFKGVEAK
jgi:PAS domain S-box-containing protein